MMPLPKLLISVSVLFGSFKNLKKETFLVRFVVGGEVEL
jgi:hypothetical protein